MSEPVFTQAFTVERDGGGTLRLVGGDNDGMGGPAGEASLLIGPGIELTVDYVDPTAVLSLEIEPEASVEQVAELVGATRAQQLVELGGGSPGSFVLQPWEPGPGEPSPTAVQLRLRELSKPVADAAVLFSMGTDLDVRSLERAAALLELLRLAEQGIVGAAIPESALDWLAGEAEDLLVLGDEELRRAAPRRRPIFDDEIESFWRRDEIIATDLALLLDDTSHRAELLGDYARRVAPGLFEDETTQRRADDGFVAAMALPDLAPEETEPFVADLRPNGRIAFRGRWRVRNKWVRVLRAGTLAPLAAVPFLEVGGGFGADAVVPTDLTLEDIVFELAEDPLPRATGNAAMVRDAVRAGRAATRAKQAGDAKGAGITWNECANLWRMAGSDWRAERAKQLASSRADLTREASLSERMYMLPPLR